MKVIETAAGARAHVGARKARAVLVPTMGALHRGHLALIERARQEAGEAGEVVVSIFVNPLQFEPGADFERYPRPQNEDEEFCRGAGVDLLFRPRPNEMYAPDASVVVEESALARGLCGASRPGHFRGVCTVVCKLFNLLAPAAAVFGEKDYQQLAIVRRMVRDLNFPIEIIGLPTVREADGLALSSRNRYLNEAERREATILRRAALATERAVKDGERSVVKLEAIARDLIATVPAARIDYIAIVDGETLEPLQKVRRPAVMAMAVFVGQTRLIDNLRLA